MLEWSVSGGYGSRFVESVEEWALRGVMEQVETDDHLFFKLGPTTQHYATASIYDKTHPGTLRLIL